MHEFAEDRVEAAGRVIASNGAARIKDGDTVLTFGHSTVVKRLLLKAKADGTNFKVIIADARYVHHL